MNHMVHIVRGMDEPTAPGATLLREYLTSKKSSILAFCEQHKLSRHQIQRYLRGDRRRMSVDFALRIQMATDGEVPVESWARPVMETVAA